MLSNLTSLNLSPYLALYDQLIPKNHLLRQINDLVDFSFVYEGACKYCRRLSNYFAWWIWDFFVRSEWFFGVEWSGRGLH